MTVCVAVVGNEIFFALDGNGVAGKCHHLPLQMPQTIDLRDAIRPKHPLPDNAFTPKPYYQVYAQKHGFIPNLSILDLLMNMGNEAILFLM